ncbi:hypothetical protein [Leucobacter sp. Psy1]|uniref:FitA-like ribbon-helix-helix domain-containing protein n=1 Tax=Leucobacter sp. Psy1 TaxID=2875729 RepID=UPI001CD23CD0|nr:hypothetical protein [Leucobacter sp. Psy1]
MSALTQEVMFMSSIIVRGLDESVKNQLVARAKRHGQSMEAEVRDILTQAAQRPNIGVALMRAAQGAGGIDDLPVPERNDFARRPVDALSTRISSFRRELPSSNSWG